jgi:hypothetical protein
MDLISANSASKNSNIETTPKKIIIVKDIMKLQQALEDFNEDRYFEEQ